MRVTIEDGYSDDAVPGRGYHAFERRVTLQALAGAVLHQFTEQRWLRFIMAEMERDGDRWMWLYEPRPVSTASDDLGRLVSSTWSILYGYDSGD